MPLTGDERRCVLREATAMINPTHPRPIQHYSVYLDDRRLAMKIFAEEIDVDGGGHKDDPEVGAVLKQALDHAQQEIPVQVTLVHLVQHNDVVAGQGWIRRDLDQ
jgi:hypothetical protein